MRRTKSTDSADKKQSDMAIAPTRPRAVVRDVFFERETCRRRTGGGGAKDDREAARSGAVNPHTTINADASACDPKMKNSSSSAAASARARAQLAVAVSERVVVLELVPAPRLRQIPLLPFLPRHLRLLRALRAAFSACARCLSIVRGAHPPACSTVIGRMRRSTPDPIRPALRAEPPRPPSRTSSEATHQLRGTDAVCRPVG